tara:strand:- start:1644 stop:1778 length:135 start_codon:yes stop_codon:yes gene_type:complete
MIDAINTWWGECILRCGYELTTLEIYLIAIVALPVVLFFMKDRI